MLKPLERKSMLFSNLLVMRLMKSVLMITKLKIVCRILAFLSMSNTAMSSEFN